MRHLERLGDSEQSRRRDGVRAARIGVRPGERVLDLGCGVGTATAVLASRVAPDGFVLGIDRSGVMVERAREHAARDGLPAKFAVGEAENLAIADHSFDLCWAKRSLVHTRAPGQVLAELFRVLRPGGRIALEEVDYAALILDATDAAIAAQVVERISRYFRHPDLARALRRHAVSAGFTDVQIRPTLWDLGNLHAVERRLHLSDRLNDLIEDGVISADAGHAFLSALHYADRKGEFTCCLPGFALLAARP